MEKNMPAYFSIHSIIRNTNGHNGMYADFINALHEEGFKFVSGGWEFFDESLDQIIDWNEKKLEERFGLGFDEHYSNDYRQIFFDYHGFSEVRMFITYETEHDEFIFTIIFPEDELLKWDKGKVTYDPNILEDIKKLITDLWDCEYIFAIQTTLELSGDITHIDELVKGISPSIVPFAIIPQEYINYSLSENNIVCDVPREGVLIQCL